MSLAKLVIAHPGGTRSLEMYTLPPRARSWARSLEAVPEEWSVHGIRVWGDERQEPQPFTIHAHVVADEGLEAAYALAFVVVGEAEKAHEVTTHEGNRAVQGIVGYAMEPDGDAVALTLDFAPTGPKVVES